MNPWQHPSGERDQGDSFHVIGTSNQGDRRYTLDQIGEYFVAKRITWEEACMFKEMVDGGYYAEVIFALRTVTFQKAA